MYTYMCKHKYILVCMYIFYYIYLYVYTIYNLLYIFVCIYVCVSIDIYLYIPLIWGVSIPIHIQISYIDKNIFKKHIHIHTHTINCSYFGREK